MKLLPLFTAAMLVSATTAGSAIELQPGEWQTTETGSENGKPTPPQVEKSCMTADEARDATNVVKQMKEEAQGQGVQCQTLDIRQVAGNTVTFTMKCGIARQAAVDMSGSFTFVSATRYSGALKSSVTFAGSTMTSDKKIEAVRVGDCKGGAAKKR